MTYTDEAILDLLKVDIGELNPSQTRQTYLLALIKEARRDLTIQGVTIDQDNQSDAMLIEQLAAEYYRKRAEDDGKVSRMTEFRIHNRILSEKGQP